MRCDDRERLEKEHVDAGAAFDAARAMLRNRIGVSPKGEYERLNAAAEEAWGALNGARKRLDEHIREHGCEAVNSASVPT